MQYAWWTIEAKDNGQEAVWYMHGDISKWSEMSAERVMAKLTELEGKHKVIHIRLHSGGGSVFEGIRMYNAIRNSKATIYIHVDGLAASMASILLQAPGKGKRKAAKHSRIMVHQSRGGAMGTAAQIAGVAKMMEGMNETMASIYSEHTGKPTADILKEWMGEGDTWFTAEEALAAGLIDEIEDVSVKQPDAQANWEQLVAHYDQEIKAIATTPAPAPAPKDDKLNPVIKMDKSKLIIALMGIGVTLPGITAESSDEDFTAALKTEVKDLKAKASEVDSLQASVKELESGQLEEALKGAVTAGKINAKQEEHYRKYADKAGAADVIAMLEEIPSPAALDAKLRTAANAKPSTTGTERENWTYADWEEKDPKGLIAMADEDSVRFDDLVSSYDPSKPKAEKSEK